MPDRISRREVDLKEDPKLISPPVLVGPAYACSNRVKVIAFIPLATIEVELNGVIVASQAVGFPEPNGALILLPVVFYQNLLAGGQASVLSSPFNFEISEVTIPVGTAMIA